MRRQLGATNLRRSSQTSRQRAMPSRADTAPEHCLIWQLNGLAENAAER